MIVDSIVSPSAKASEISNLTAKCLARVCNWEPQGLAEATRTSVIKWQAFEAD
ncbi:hypothetical protein C1H46_021466 [Malus baccata]|uniref:Uncharacterized protein n=1 Tax=Malus baccata TaxID=106549 RepID=A0A540M2S7_MALBA|nr:hypothetical protein C1H46_021466 [Malus baccata]